MRRILLLTALVQLVLAVPAFCVDMEEEENFILDVRSFWRVRIIRETNEVVLPDGKIEHAVFNTPGGYEFFQKNPMANQVPSYTVKKVPVFRLPSDTSPDWMKNECDDSTWARLHGRVLDGSIDTEWKVILLRGMFRVDDPKRGGILRFSMTFRGGAVVYMNGVEAGRAYMPKGDVNTTTPAEPYPQDAYLNDKGFLFYRGDRSEAVKPFLAKRIHEIKEMQIPGRMLRKGVNVLAVAIHRAPTDWSFFLRRNKGSAQCNPPHNDNQWAKLGLVKLRLVAEPAAAITANVGPDKDRVTLGCVLPGTGPLAGRTFHAWNHSIIQDMPLNQYPDPFLPLLPLRLTGVRNGIFAAQFVVGQNEETRGLKVSVTDLKGAAGAIPASAVQIRYAKPDMPTGGAPLFDSLEEVAPDEVPIYKQHGGSVQPIWVTVTVPPDAKPGDYTAAITVRADDVKPIELPLYLRVIDWALPSFDKFTCGLDLMQSPESVALAYDVPLWSAEHLKLLDRTFEQLRPLATKTVYVTCIRRTHLGNEHAQLRWVRDAEGELKPDFTVVEKYLDLATKHLGKVPGVVLYAWEPKESEGHAGGTGTASRTYDKPALITMYDPATKQVSARQGPPWGTPEAPVFWKKMIDGIKPILQKRGLENSMLFGLIGDARPTQQAMDDICSSIGKTARWGIHSHFYSDNWKGYPMGMIVALWGIGCTPVDPSAGYCFGWTNPKWLAYYPREMHLTSTLVEHRVKLEKWMAAKPGYTAFLAKGAGPCGLGRLGVDFWSVLRDERGRIRGSLAGRFPESYWGQLNLTYGVPYLLGRGVNGPVATVRSESLREAIQEIETRVYLEKAMLEDDAKTVLGEDLLGRCRAALDERIRMCLHADGEGEPWFISSDWGKRTEQLFLLASEVSKKLGGRDPKPNITPEPVKR